MEGDCAARCWVSSEARDDARPVREITYYLEPGYIYFTKRAAAIRTVVGSCVAVSLWDKEMKFGGMNHFIRPVTYDKELATPQYGNVATAALLRVMEEAGCQRENLVAQIFGGGHPEGSSASDIGRKNADVARRVLSRKGVQILSEDVGGNMGWKIIFDTGTGESAIIKVHRIRETDWL